MDIRTVQDEMRAANERLHALVARAESEDRDFTAEENTEKAELVARMTALDGKRQRSETFADLLRSVSGLQAPQAAAARPANGTITRIPNEEPVRRRSLSLGEEFVATDVYAQLRTMPKSGQWATPTVELQAAVTITGTPALPAGLEITGPLPYPPDWGVAGLFSRGTLDGGLVQYLQETVWTNAAAVVAVAGTKPESTKTFELKQQGLTKIAHWIGCPDEFLEDVAGLRSFIDAQMRGGVIEELNDQLVNGSGTGGNLTGLIALPGKAPTIPVVGTGVSAGVAAIAAQSAAIYTLSRLRPDSVVMSPNTWAGLSTAVTSAGGFLATPNAFAAGVAPQVWGLRVVATPEVPDGTAIVGAFSQGGQLYSKGGVSVQATNSHQDFFSKNITAIRAEIRVAVVYYRPQAFGLVTGMPTVDITP